MIPGLGKQEGHYSDQMDLDKIVDLKPMVEPMSERKEVKPLFVRSFNICYIFTVPKPSKKL